MKHRRAHEQRATALRVVCLCAILSAPIPTRAQTQPSSESSALLIAAMEAARLDVKQAVEDLNAWRDHVSETRQPVADKVRKLEHEVATLRERVRKLRTDEAYGEQAQRERRARMRQAEESALFAHTLLSEYRRAMETRAGTAEIQALAERTDALDVLLADPKDFARLPQSARQTLDLAETWNRERLGGRRFEGAALDKDGLEHPGTFLQWGPLAYFIANDGQQAGWIVSRLGSALPGIEPMLSPSQKSALTDILNGQTGLLPLDPTSGDALKISAARRSFVEHLVQGGIVMIPILALGLTAFALIVIKALQMRRFRVGDETGIREALRHLNNDDVEAARARAEAMGVPFGALLRSGIQYRNAPREHIEEILHERLLSHMPDLEKHLGTLAALGGIAPLLGLLGTVTGIMRTFQLVTVFGTGDAKLLSGGISEALVTTEFGLIIAIPALLAHALFARRVRTMVGAMEHGMTVFVNELTVKKDASCETS